MRALFQRVSAAGVRVDADEISAIGPGMLVFVGVAAGDGEADAAYIARKLAEVRVFPDAAGRFNCSILDVGGQALVVSQFTLLGETRHGRRPSFSSAASPELAAPLVERVAALLRDRGIATVTGRFGAHMHVSLTNDGPVTLLFDSRAG